MTDMRIPDERVSTPSAGSEMPLAVAGTETVTRVHAGTTASDVRTRMLFVLDTLAAKLGESGRDGSVSKPVEQPEGVIVSLQYGPVLGGKHVQAP
mmetsp:Transcript_13744/g.21468  ORF Transcript_13744/g.21468 Transcript_13744/m.21468 type:complete len:95 (-) Transcript_13744:998-1282(-)